MHPKTLQLPSLSIGKQAHITAIDADDALLHRLTALGFRTGKPIQIIRRANFKGPFQYSSWHNRRHFAPCRC